MSKSQSMLNNLKSISGNKYEANKAIELIRKLKEKTRKSEKDILEQMVLYAFNNSPEYAALKTSVGGGLSELNAKACLSAIRSMTGKTEQSILVSMIMYSSERQPLPSKDREHAARPTLQADQPQ